MRIAEPRVVRLMQFGVYLSMFYTGCHLIITPPTTFKDVVGLTLVYVWSGFVALGAGLSMVAVLPGIWWLERAGIIALTTGLAMYIVILSTVTLSPVGISVSIALVITFIQRWREIKGAQLAPREE